MALWNILTDFLRREKIGKPYIELSSWINHRERVIEFVRLHNLTRNRFYVLASEISQNRGFFFRTRNREIPPLTGDRYAKASATAWQTGDVLSLAARCHPLSFLRLCLEFITANPIFAVALRTWTTSQSCQRRSSRGGGSAWVAGRALTATNWPRGCFTCIKACLPAGTSCCLTCVVHKYEYKSLFLPTQAAYFLAQNHYLNACIRIMQRIIIIFS